VGSGESLL